MKSSSITKIQLAFLTFNINLFVTAYLFPYVYPRLELNAKTNGKLDDPLILTPYLKNGSSEIARNLSLVSITEQLKFVSHSGFLTINEQFNSNLFFWYFPPLLKNDSAPIILWLQGGPGGSSLFGLFAEIGPLVATKKGFLLRKYNWAINYHLIFVDNPVGTGFSFTNNDEGYCKDENSIADGLFIFLKQFFTLFPSLRSNEFYIAGESYAGKYIPYLAAKIHLENSSSGNKINLQGLMIGDGYCDPVHQIDYGLYLYQLGLLDDIQLKVFENIQKEIVKEIKAENWLTADILMDKLLGGALSGTSYFQQFTGFKSFYNILKTEPEDMSELIKLLNNDKVRNSVHVGGLPFNSGSTVQMYLFNDILKTAAPIISELLSHYRILFYNGQLDIVVAYPLTEKFLIKLDFNSADEYRNASRKIWKVGGDIAGYFKQAGNLTEVLVRNAGHMVPMDQPEWAFDLLTKFVKNNFVVT